MIEIVNAPKKFMPINKLEFPVGNTYPFEDWFVNVFLYQQCEFVCKTRKYLPVKWTAYTVNNNWGQDLEKKQELQDYIDSLPRNEKYFTIVQQGCGILQNLKDLDIVVFSMAGGIENRNNTKIIPIPLFYNLPRSLKIDATKEKMQRKYVASFVGRKSTHTCRKKIKKLCALDSNCFVFFDSGDVDYISFENSTLFQETIKNSVFAFCPRGAGETSYRIFEALYYGAIPIYISDIFHIPFNIDFNEYGIQIETKNINSLKDILLSYTDIKIKNLRIAGNNVFQSIYNYNSTAKKIINLIE